MSQFHIISQTIEADTYRSLRSQCGLSPKSAYAAFMGLRNSLFSVAVMHEEQIVGMGRLVGDGALFCQIVDICVLPEFQGRGLGKRVMSALMDFAEKNLPNSCYISLIADGDARHLYEQFGFKDTLPKSRGMYYRINK